MLTEEIKEHDFKARVFFHSGDCFELAVKNLRSSIFALDRGVKLVA